jgi:hypothetical protein
VEAGKGGKCGSDEILQVKTQQFGLSAYGRQRECNVSTWHGGPTDDDVFYLFLQKQKSAQSSIPQGYFPQHEAV